MRFYQSLQFVNLPDLLPLADHIERETTIDGVFLGDHGLHPHTLQSRYPYRSEGEPLWPPSTHWPHLGATMGAIGARTSRLHVTTSIMTLPLRHPIDVASMMASLAVIAEGRVSLGVGVGWSQDEYAAMGIDFTRRGRRCSEMIDVMRLLWTGEVVEYHGEFFDIPPSSMSPAPASGHIPVYVGGNSTAAKERALTRGDGWITAALDHDQLHNEVTHFMRLLRDSDREGDFEIIATARPDLRVIEELATLGVTTVYLYPSLADYAGDRTAQQKLDDIMRTSEEIVARF